MVSKDEVLQVEHKGKVSVISFKSSELDMDENGVFYEEIKDLVRKKRIFILVDFSKISYISSLVIATLISGLKNTKAQGGNFKLCCLSAKIRQTLEVIQLDKIIEIFKTQEEGINNNNWYKQEGNIEFK